MINGERQSDDWIVLRRGVPVGRVLLDRFPRNGAKPCSWHKQIGKGVNGREDSLEEALKAIRNAIERIENSRASQ